jgi:oligo-alginate lyase
VMSALANHHYAGVRMQRTMLLLRDARLRYPVVVDMYRVVSDAAHMYDYPIHFRGQLINTNFKYETQLTRRDVLGTANGYQHLFREASARTDDPVQLTWLDGNRYYTVTTAAAPSTQVILARTGANDPNFNLISEPLMLVRRSADTHLFASAIEPHGYFNEAQERSAQARPIIKSVRVLGHNAEGSVIEVAGDGGLLWTVMVSNGRASSTARHSLNFGGQTYEWTGNYAVRGIR